MTEYIPSRAARRTSEDRLVRRIKSIEDRLSKSVRTPQLPNSAIDDGAITVTQDGAQVGIIGQQYDGTNGYITIAGPNPPVPAPPAMTTAPGGVIVSVSGGFADPQVGFTSPVVAPLDFVGWSVEVDTTTTFTAPRKYGVSSAAGGQVTVLWPTTGTPLYARVRSRTSSGKISNPSTTVGPIPSGTVGLVDIGFDLANYAASNTIIYSTTQPANPTRVGTLWMKEIAAGPPPKYETWRWTGVAWQLLQDQGVTTALANAAAAQTAADTKAKLFTQATTPTYSGAANTAYWINTSTAPGNSGNLPEVWNGTGWTLYRLGNGAIQPNSLIASNVIATGTVSAALLEAIMVIANVMVAGNPTGDRVQFSAQGIQQVKSGNVTFNLSPDGSAYFAGILSGKSSNYQEGVGGWQIESDGDAAFQSVQVLDNVTAKTVSTTSLDIQGQPIEQLLTVKPDGLVSQGFNDTLNLQGIVAETGFVELGFIAYPGRGYWININGPVYACSDSTTWIGNNVRATLDGSAPSPTSLIIAILGDKDGGPDSPSSWPWRVLNGGFLWYPNATNSAGQQMRLLLTMARVRGAGNVGMNATQYRVQMSVYEQGSAFPNSMRVNNATVVAPPPPPPPPVQRYEETFYTTWTASYRANGTRWSDSDRMYQGNGDSFNGNQASFMGFDYNYIRSKLTGSTITWAKLYIHNLGTWNNSGGTAFVGSHGSAGVPATYTGGAFERRSSTYTPKGGWIEVDVLGIFNEIRDGASTGLILGRAPDDNNAWYGYWHGQNAGILDMPRVVVRWER